MKIALYCILAELRDIFIPSFSLPVFKHPALMVQKVEFEAHYVSKKIAYQPPKSICKKSFTKGHRQR